ncbi:tetratricopeptide (TPR) repeat protein [Caldalkalibacillus uzonensis]|uniref:Tetratricopeptide (TPR) repeat protein n=1 Tax=Caldalkalibacillus uzonensis TaxID=353224 RepID=A0ABU0CST3_9BACI|nr:SEC-C domain-containing protein [Caldalkalibacillus uzonensis]MDQ0338550.1 tetratricopeptide (TPR) repeat protein [Caldalkalibacillus uzonensis]
MNVKPDWAQLVEQNILMQLDGIDEHDPGLQHILDEHPEVKLLMERRSHLPDQVVINGVNPILHVYMEGIVENQLADPQLESLQITMRRLRDMGLSDHAARANIVRVFIHFFYQTLKSKQPFDTEGYHAAVRLLGVKWKKTGRNDPCPCDSGRKYKRCCMPVKNNVPVLAEIDPMAGLLCLGQGAYYFGSPALIAKDPLDPLLQLENRAHIAHYFKEAGDMKGAELALKENVRQARKMDHLSYLNNALQDLQMFYQNHSGYEQQALEVTEELMDLAEDEYQRGNYWCDKADILADAGQVAQAEEEYQHLFKAMPNWQYGRYRYASFLEHIGRKAEAVSLLKELVAAQENIDEETWQAARDLLDTLEQ